MPGPGCVLSLGKIIGMRSVREKGKVMSRLVLASVVALWATAPAANEQARKQPEVASVVCAFFDEDNMPLGRVDREVQGGHRPDKKVGTIRFAIAYRTAPIYEICQLEFADGSERTIKRLAPPLKHRSVRAI